MSHLREQISALIDGELTGAELDRANAHLAACGRCRTEAMALRQLKRELRALAAGPFDTSADAPARSDTSGASGASGVSGAFAGPASHVPWQENAGGAPGPGPGPGAGGSTDEALTRRLLAMAGPGGPVPSRRFRREQFRHNSREQRGGPQAAGRGGASASRRRHAEQRYDERPPRAARRHGRYVIWSAVSVVVVGIGAAAFSMGGSPAEPGPKVTPQLEMFSVEHAITSGDVPFPDPTQAPTARP